MSGPGRRAVLTTSSTNAAVATRVRADGAFVLAHLSDPHVPSPLTGRVGAYLNKRVFGLLSWTLRRRHIHRHDVLAALCRDVAAHHPDHIAVTGDIVNIALPEEFAAARRWLEALGPADRVTVVPGNHDAYVAVPWARSLALWGPFMAGDGGGMPAPAAFPFVRRRGDVALIGLSTAVPTAPAIASGTLGREQLRALAECLMRLKAEGAFRIILLHHPPRGGPTPKHKQLTDARAFADVLAAAGAELVLHGHDHRFRLETLPGRDGPVTVIGVPSASAAPRGTVAAAQYHLCTIARHGRGWSLHARLRRFDPAPAAMVDAGERRIDVPRAAAGAVARPL